MKSLKIFHENNVSVYSRNFGETQFPLVFIKTTELLLTVSIHTYTYVYTPSITVLLPQMTSAKDSDLTGNLEIDTDGKNAAGFH